MFVLFNFIFTAVLSFIDNLLGWTSAAGLGVLGGIYGLAVIIPGLAVSVRRLHDLGKSGWYFLLALIPIAGPIVLLVWFCREGTPADC